MRFGLQALPISGKPYVCGCTVEEEIAHGARFCRSRRVVAAYVGEGDTLEAICAYRAALTLDTSAGGRPLPAEARQRARDRLTALAKKAGLSESWGNVQRKAAEVTPASIEQQLRANRLGEAVQAYKQSPEYKGRTKARFRPCVLTWLFFWSNVSVSW